MKLIKLSRTSWLIMTFGFFIILLAGLGVVRYQQIGRQNELNEELALAQAKLETIQTEPLSRRQEELEQQLSQTKSKAETAKATLSQPIKSLTISDTLFAVAEANSVEITELSSPGISSEELDGVPCSTLSLTTRVEGEVTNLVSFITQLNDALATGVVKSVEISIPETLSEDSPSAYIQMVIYSYQGG